MAAPAPIEDMKPLRHDARMGWIAEWIIQGFWEGAVEVAYRRWGWFGGIAAFLLPIMLVALAVWLLVR